MSHITLGALILAGGQNRRMGGSPKALLPNGSGALILDGLRAAFAGFDEKLLSTNTPELAAGTGFAPVPDARPGMGPLAGLAAALSACQSDRACGVRPDFGPAAVLDYDSKRISVHRANRFSRDQLRRTIIIEKTLAVPFYLNRLRLYGQHAVFVCNFVIFSLCIHRNNRVSSNIAKLRIAKRIVQTRKRSFVLIIHESIDFRTIIT